MFWILARTMSILTEVSRSLSQFFPAKWDTTYIILNHFLQNLLQFIIHHPTINTTGSKFGVWTTVGTRNFLFHTCPDQPWGQTSLPYNGYWNYFLRVQLMGHDVEHPPYLVPRLRTSTLIPLLLLRLHDIWQNVCYLLSERVWPEELGQQISKISVKNTIHNSVLNLNNQGHFTKITNSVCDGEKRVYPRYSLLSEYHTVPWCTHK